MFKCYVVYTYTKDDYVFVRVLGAFWIIDHAIEFVQKRLSFGYGDNVVFTIVEEDFIECLN